MSSGTIHEASRETPVSDEVDVLVVGAGPAGIGAAVGAARTGARTLLVEKHGCVGGMLTAGSVLNMRTFNDGRRQVIGGVGAELVERIRAAGGTENTVETGPLVRHDPEITKFVAQELVLSSGARLLLHTFVAGAVLVGQDLRGIIVENKDGRVAILAAVTVDATGDGDVICRAGAAFEKAVEDLQPMTLAFVIGGVRSWPRVLPPEVREKIERAIAEDEFPTTRPPALFPLLHEGYMYANATRIPGDCTRAADLTNGEVEGRRQAFALLEWLRENAPGYETAHIVSSGAQVGLRESRRLVGCSTLSRDDVFSREERADTVARGAYAIDIHSPGKGTEMVWLEPGMSYCIPYGCLVPKVVNGLLAAGRCLSASHDALGSARAIATCTATGHAAGVAAALSAAKHCQPRDLNVQELREVLLAQGAILI